MMTEQRLNQLNKWLIIATVATALFYTTFAVYEAHPWKSRCCDGPCWDGPLE